MNTTLDYMDLIATVHSNLVKGSFFVFSFFLFFLFLFRFTCTLMSSIVLTYLLQFVRRYFFVFYVIRIRVDLMSTFFEILGGVEGGFLINTRDLSEAIQHLNNENISTLFFKYSPRQSRLLVFNALMSATGKWWLQSNLA